MKTLTGMTTNKNPALRGTPINTREVMGEKTSSIALVAGMISSGLTFNIVSHLNGGPIDTFTLLLQTMGVVVAGGTSLGVPAYMVSTAMDLRKKVHRLNPQKKKVSLFSAYRMLSWLRPKETVLSLGVDSSGQELQALVSSNFHGTNISEVRAPKAIDLWDSAAFEVVKLYGISAQTIAPRQRISA